MKVNVNDEEILQNGEEEYQNGEEENQNENGWAMMEETCSQCFTPLINL